MEKIHTLKWLDSSLQEHQVDKHNFPKPTIINTVGFIIDETSDYITLARDNMGGGDYRGLICIPKIAILDE